MRAKLPLVFSAIVLVFAACTQDSTGGNPAPPGRTAGSVPSDVLLLGTDEGPVTVSLRSGSVLLERAGAVAAPDGSRLYSASSDGGYTTLASLDAATGATLSSSRIRGDLDVRIASGSGRAVALMEPLGEGLDPWTPVPRSHTTIVVADPTGAREPRRYRLRGNFEPESFSSTDSRLFMIQYLPAEAPAVYRVTALDLADGQVDSVHGRFKTPPERMPGIRLRQVLDPEKAQLYTLYSSKPGAYSRGYGSWDQGGRPVTFVHVLNLRGGWAYCAGLPKRFWGQPASSQAMAASPDGELLYIVDSDRGVISVMDTKTLEILRTEKVGLGSVGGVRTSAQVSADGGTLFVGSAQDGSGVYAIDTAGFNLAGRWPIEGMVSGLGLSADGLRLYAALGDRVAALDPVTGRELASVPFSGGISLVDSIAQVGLPGA